MLSTEDGKKTLLQQNFSPSDKQAELLSDSFSWRSISQWHVAGPKGYFEIVFNTKSLSWSSHTEILSPF